jgi:hypothetical protein
MYKITIIDLDGMEREFEGSLQIQRQENIQNNPVPSVVTVAESSPMIQRQVSLLLLGKLTEEGNCRIFESTAEDLDFQTRLKQAEVDIRGFNYPGKEGDLLAIQRLIEITTRSRHMSALERNLVTDTGGSRGLAPPSYGGSQNPYLSYASR